MLKIANLQIRGDSIIIFAECDLMQEGSHEQT